ncbi:MAG: trypsin-like peptidase domain-containing protein [Firmicutes bacterium]|nr:trypsin-like peptidase domain-containing protein [Bacillota bacterium]
MNEENKRNINENYGANFVMYDSPQDPTKECVEAAASYAEETAKAAQRAQHVQGTYADPRQNFTSEQTSSWTNGEVKINKVKKKPHKKSKPVQFTRKSLALMIAICMLLCGCCGFGGVMLGSSMAGGPAAAPTSSTSSNGIHTTGYTLESATGSPLTVKEITSKCQPSVVEIKTESVASDSWMQQYVTQGAGSGVIISDDGYIMTNNHVIDDANNITVTTIDGKEYEAKLVGTDQLGDVAVIKIDAKGLTPATYGNSDELEVGDLAVAIGNPLGELGGTVTAGIISATDRELSIDGKTLHLLQTDSSINPGNSGGGLFNGEGQFIGLVVAKSSGSDVEGLGFAIPINTAAEKAQQLKTKGYVSGQPWTGMKYTEGQSQSSMFGMFGGNSGSSVYIAEVVSNEAKLAGFKEGDMVFAVDDKQITSFEDLSSTITSHKVGDTLKFTVVRDGNTMDLHLKLQERKGE